MVVCLVSSLVMWSCNSLLLMRTAVAPLQFPLKLHFSAPSLKADFSTVSKRINILNKFYNLYNHGLFRVLLKENSAKVIF